MGKLFRKTFLKTDVEHCWAFFSSPENLSKITPKNMDFTISNFDGKKMYEGQIITYIVKPLLNIKMTWISKITNVTEGKEFVDVQLKGPYKVWHHRHMFKQVDDGVEMIDMVHYAIPFGILGKIVERVFVRKKLNQIFDYREKVIEELFE